MKKTNKAAERDSLRREYAREDFGRGVRGKYAGRVGRMSQVVVLEPDVAKVFPDAARVNEALRMLMKVARKAG